MNEITNQIRAIAASLDTLATLIEKAAAPTTASAPIEVAAPIEVVEPAPAAAVEVPTPSAIREIVRRYRTENINDMAAIQKHKEGVSAIAGKFGKLDDLGDDDLIAFKVEVLNLENPF